MKTLEEKLLTSNWSIVAAIVLWAVIFLNIR